VSQEARNEEDKEVVGECYFESLPQEIILRVRLARTCVLLRLKPTLVLYTNRSWDSPTAEMRVRCGRHRASSSHWPRTTSFGAPSSCARSPSASTRLVHATTGV
jgi:hypothetical protein